METQWYCRTSSNKVFGPFLTSDLKKLAKQGKIGPRTLLRAGDTGEWRAASEVDEILPGDPPLSSRITKQTFIGNSPPRPQPDNATDGSGVPAFFPANVENSKSCFSTWLRTSTFGRTQLVLGLLAGFCLGAITLFGAFILRQTQRVADPVQTAQQHSETEKTAKLPESNDLTKKSKRDETAISPKLTSSDVSSTKERTVETGLQRAGYSVTRCLICNRYRSIDAMRDYSDARGYGMCSHCGTCYHAWTRTIGAFQRGLQPLREDAAGFQQFKAILGNHFRSEARRGLGMFFWSGKFASREWDAIVGGN